MFQARALKFFSNAVRVGNYLTGITVYIKAEATATWILTDDRQHVKSWKITRRSLKLKFVRPKKNE